MESVNANFWENTILRPKIWLQSHTNICKIKSIFLEPINKNDKKHPNNSINVQWKIDYDVYNWTIYNLIC